MQDLIDKCESAEENVKIIKAQNEIREKKKRENKTKRGKKTLNLLITIKTNK